MSTEIAIKPRAAPVCHQIIRTSTFTYCSTSSYHHGVVLASCSWGTEGLNEDDSPVDCASEGRITEATTVVDSSCGTSVTPKSFPQSGSFVGLIVNCPFALNECSHLKNDSTDT
jgi:hypothetical protein